MGSLYDSSAPKKATNLSINRDLLEAARSLKINLSKLLEERLIDVVGEEARRRWAEENGPAMEDFNHRVEARGVFSDGLRRF